MRNWIGSLLFHIFWGKEAEYMIAMLWCQEIMCGDHTYAQVPAKLKDQVRDLLVKSGCEHLIAEE